MQCALTVDGAAPLYFFPGDHLALPLLPAIAVTTIGCSGSLSLSVNSWTAARIPQQNLGRTGGQEFLPATDFEPPTLIS